MTIASISHSHEVLPMTQSQEVLDRNPIQVQNVDSQDPSILKILVALGCEHISRSWSVSHSLTIVTKIII